jgi:hypothetical protein
MRTVLLLIQRVSSCCASVAREQLCCVRGYFPPAFTAFTVIFLQVYTPSEMRKQ